MADWYENWGGIISASFEFSKKDNFFRRQKGIEPLSNLLEVLEENPPPSR